MREIDFKARGIWLVQIVRNTFQHLAPIRVPVFVVLVGIAMTVSLDQVRELFGISVAGVQNRDGTLQFFLTSCLATFLGAACWRSARILLNYDIISHAEAPRTYAHPAFRRLAPRVLGMSVPLAVALAYATSEPFASALICAAFVAASSGVFFLAIYYRRRIFAKPEVDPQLSLKTWKSSVPWIEWFLASAAFALVNAVAIVQPEWIARAAPIIGPIGCILLLASLLVGIATPLVFFGALRRAPVFTMLFIWACLIQSCGLVDNHHISVVHEQSPGNRSIESLDTRINQWLDRNSTSDSHAETNCPYAFFISAEGGGIRASAWTALVLARLEREVGDARFADCIVSGSGVSGGSLGLAAFVAGRKVLNVSATSGNDEDSLDGRLQRMLEADFISPLVTVAFTTDQLQRIVPGVRLTDRGTALESAFSGAFEEAFSTGKHLRQDVVQSFANPFREAFTSLYNTTMPSETLWNWTPILLLNTTDVRSGERVIQAGLPLPSGMDMEKDFPAAMDGNCAMGNGVSLVGAIHNSARFAYVSPAGNSPCQPRRQVVDGGYFENSGATTSYDMLKLYLRLADRKPHQVSPKPVVIHISNDVSLASFDQQTGEQEHCPNEDEPNHPYGEIIPPPLALYRTRSAHGQHARLLLRQTMREIANQNEPDSACSTEKGSCFFFFALGYHDQCRGFPLGWQIGRSSMCEMLRQRDGQGANAKTFGRFEDLFVGSGSQYETRLCHDSSTQARP